ncbi:MAG: porin [Deltaproteobacteria bacterium]|nr:porin [Deltaproteobacteria bacterium]
MIRIPAAVAAALLALGAQAQTPDPAAAPPAPAPAPKAEKRWVIAEKSNLSISGRAWAEFHNVGADAGSVAGASKVPDRWRVHNNSSYLRIKGDIELVPGWKALAQIEAEFGIEGENGLPFSGTRNTGVGLSSPYGQLILGRWDSPMKQTTIGIDPFGGTGIFGYYNVFGQQQVSPTGQGANRWDRRLNNSLNYTSPDIYGLKILAAYSVGETASAVAPKVNPWTASAALQYKRGPLYVGVAYETRNDCGNPDADAPGGPSCSTAALGAAAQPLGTDTGLRVGASYDIKQTWTKLGVAYEHIDLMAKATATLPKKTLQRDVYWGVITQGLMSNQHQIIVAYGMASDASGANVWTGATGTKDTGASYLTAAYRFYFNKDTDLYAGYVQVKNDKNASYRFGSGNFGAVPVGSTSTGYGAGIRYFF